MKKEIGSVYFRHFDGWYWFRHWGVKVKLVKGIENKEAAIRKRDEYMATAKYSPTDPTKKLDNEPASDILRQYLEHGMASHSRGRQNFYRRVVTLFVAKFKDIKYSDLNSVAVKDWLEKVPSWNMGARRNAGQALKRAFQHWFLADKLERNRLANLRLPEPAGRTEEFAISRETHERLIALAAPWLADILVYLWCVGCRPGECLGTTAAEYVPQLQCVDKATHKTASQGHRRRIALGGTALGIIQRLVAMNPTGKLFRGPKGGTVTNARLSVAVRKLVAAAGIPDEQARFIIPYSWRHAAAVRWIESGLLSEYDVAQSMGHSVGVLRRHYAYTLRRANRLSDKLTALE